MTNKHVKLQFFKFSVQNFGFISFIDKLGMHGFYDFSSL